MPQSGPERPKVGRALGPELGPEGPRLEKWLRNRSKPASQPGSQPVNRPDWQGNGNPEIPSAEPGTIMRRGSETPLQTPAYFAQSCTAAARTELLWPKTWFFLVFCRLDERQTWHNHAARVRDGSPDPAKLGPIMQRGGQWTLRREGPRRQG